MLWYGKEDFSTREVCREHGITRVIHGMVTYHNVNILLSRVSSCLLGWRRDEKKKKKKKKCGDCVRNSQVVGKKVLTGCAVS